jgi:hypothetical protein
MSLLIMGTTATGLRNCNGNGATGATGNETGALGQEQREQQGAMAMTMTMATAIDRSLPLRSIDRVCGRGAWGAGVGDVYSAFYSKKLVNAKKRSE